MLKRAFHPVEVVLNTLIVAVFLTVYVLAFLPFLIVALFVIGIGAGARWIGFEDQIAASGLLMIGTGFAIQIAAAV